MNEDITFEEFDKIRKRFLKQQKNEHFTYKLGENNVLISIPHGVAQVRLGKPKWSEPGTIPFGLVLAERLKASYIVRTRNIGDDPNFDEINDYKTKIEYILSVRGINYLIDIHSLSKKRECDVNWGIRLGNNIKNNVDLFMELDNSLKQEGFVVYTDQPFMANQKTIAGHFAEKFNLWSIQIEINSKITRLPQNEAKLNLLLDILTRIFKKYTQSK